MSDRTYVEGAGIRLLQDNLERCFYTAGKIVYEAVVDHLTKEAREKGLRLPPGYRPAAGTQRCQSCRYGYNMGTFCSKYKTDVDPNYVCDNWRMRADLEDIVRSNTINYIKRINRKLSDISSSIPDTDVIGEVKISTDVSGTGAATSPAAVVRHATYAGRGNQSPQDVLSLIKSMLAQSPMRRIYGKLNDTVDVESLKAKPLVNPLPADNTQMQKVGQGQGQTQNQSQGQTQNQGQSQPQHQSQYINVRFARGSEHLHMATGMFGDESIFRAYGSDPIRMLDGRLEQYSEVHEFLSHMIDSSDLNKYAKGYLRNFLVNSNKQLEEERKKILDHLRSNIFNPNNRHVLSEIQRQGINPRNISQFYIVGDRLYLKDDKKVAAIPLREGSSIYNDLIERMHRIASNQMWLMGSIVDTMRQAGVSDEQIDNMIDTWVNSRKFPPEQQQRAPELKQQLRARLGGFIHEARQMAEGNNALLDPLAVAPGHIAEIMGRRATDRQDIPISRNEMMELRARADILARDNKDAIYSRIQSARQGIMMAKDDNLSNAMSKYNNQYPHPQINVFGEAANKGRTFIDNANSDIRGQIGANRDGLVTISGQALTKLTEQSSGIGIKALAAALADPSEEGQRLRNQFLEYAKATGLAQSDPAAFNAIATASQVAKSRSPGHLENMLQASLSRLTGLTGPQGPRPGANTDAMKLLAGFNAYTNGAISSFLQNSNNLADRNAATVIDLYSSAYIQGVDPATLLRRGGSITINGRNGNMWITGQRGELQQLDFMSGDKNLVGKDFGHGGHIQKFVERINQGGYGNLQSDAAKTVTLMYTNAGTMITTYDPSDGSFKTYKVSDKVVGPEYFLKQNANVYILSNGGKYHKVTMNENGLQVSTRAENIPIEWRAATANQQQFEQLRKTIDHINELNKNTPMSPAMRQEYAAYASTVYGAPTVLQFANPSMPSRNPFERPETKFYIYGRRPIERFAPDIEGMELAPRQVERTQLSVPAFASGQTGSSGAQPNQPGGQPGPGAQPNQPGGQPGPGAQPNQPGGQPGPGAQPNQPGGQPGPGAQPNQPGGQPGPGAQPNQPGGQPGPGAQPNQPGGQP